MKIVGCDLHARQQTIAMVDTESGEFVERALSHEGNALREFYGALEGRVVVGIEATGSMQWFLKLPQELGIQCRPIGLTLVELRRRDGLLLYVRGIDMLDETPLLDIKPYISGLPAETSRRGWLAEAEARQGF